MLKKPLLVILMLALSGAAVLAAQISYGPYTIGPSLNNWSSAFVVPTFNPSLGTLTGIDFTMRGLVGGTCSVHNNDTKQNPVGAEFQANIVLKRPDATTIATCLPIIDAKPPYKNVLPNTTAFVVLDRVISNPDLSTDYAHPAGDLTLFKGAGTISLPVTSTDSTYLMGPKTAAFIPPGPIDVMNTTVQLTVTYTYTLAVGTVADPPIDIRCYMAQPTGTPGTQLTLPDITFHRSNLRERYVCSYCGYSTGTPGSLCPNPWNLPTANHPVNPPLVDMGSSLERVLNIPNWDMDAAHSDIIWHTSAGAPLYRAVVGMPFHPTTNLTAGGSPVTSVTDPRNWGRLIWVRVGFPTLPINVNYDVDTDFNGNEDIQVGDYLRVVLLPPGADFPTGDPAAVTGAKLFPPTLGSGVGDAGSPTHYVFDATTAGPQTLPPNFYGVCRLFLEWRHTTGPSVWRYDGDTRANVPFTGPPTVWGTCYVSRLQIPWTQNTWRNGGAENATFSGGAFQSGSYLARILAGIPSGGLSNDLFIPGALTPRRNFTVVNRGSVDDANAVEEDLQGMLLQSLAAPPGVTAPGRPGLRPTLPDSAVRIGPAGYGAGQVAPTAVDTNHWIQFALPNCQPSSEPGGTLPRNSANNWGYRGLALLYNDFWPGDLSRASANTANGKWNFSLSDYLRDSTTDKVEDFCPFDVQVSVDKNAGLLATSGAAEPGRVSPGVTASAPDTTTTAVPAGRFPFGANRALASSFTVANQGNVVLPPSLLLSNQATALPVEAGNRMRSLARLLAANPVWLRLPATPYMESYAGLFSGSLLPGLGGAAAGWGTPGTAGEGSATTPIPLGQALGQYSGQVIYFQDLAGDGFLHFINGQTGTATDTSVMAFDPTRDEPLEPVAYAPTSLRVTETRLPYNDYYASDTEPTLRFLYDANGPTGLQFIWESNRASLATGGVAVNAEAPAASDDTAASQATYPGNLLFGQGTLQKTSDYRNYQWGAASPFDKYDAYALTNLQAATVPGAANSSPETFDDLSGQHWLFWHRSVPVGAGVESTLRWRGSGNLGWAGTDKALSVPGVAQQGIRGFAPPTGASFPVGPWWTSNLGDGVWLFWAEGQQGHQDLHYRWNFSGTPTTIANEAPLPITNAVTPDQRSDLIYDFASGQAIRKPPAGPFVYAKDPSPFLWTDQHSGAPLGAQLNVVFSGYLARQQNEDLCWAAFDPASMHDGSKNYGKLTFPRVVNDPVLPRTNTTNPPARAGEQLEGNGLRQVFTSRHLDWLVSGATSADPHDFATNPLAGTDPAFYLGLTFRLPSGVPGLPQVYQVSWTNGSYSRARGIYTVTPTFTPITAGAPALPWASGQPANPLGGGGPVTMQIEPASGTVTFSTPLFNASYPGDTSCVFNTALTGLSGAADLINLTLYADYTPFIFRITTSDANDDCPNAFAETDATDPNQMRLVFLWRRTYSEKDTPHFGRTAFMYKTWTLGTQVAQPPFSGGAPTVAYWTWNGSTWALAPFTANTDYTVNSNSGMISLTPDNNYAAAASKGVFWLKSMYDGAVLQVTYNGGLIEQHRVIGWSRETPVPVDTVQNEGPLRAVPEVYTVSTAGGANPPQMNVVRYWLTWASPRPLYDLRLPAANGVGSVMQRSSDVYCATVMPTYGADLREQEVDWQNVQ